MKNKKLFAILTLVCFMFTLMPVAAFAADPVKTVELNKALFTAGELVDDANNYVLQWVENGKTKTATDYTISGLAWNDTNEVAIIKGGTVAAGTAVDGKYIYTAAEVKSVANATITAYVNDSNADDYGVTFAITGVSVKADFEVELYDENDDLMGVVTVLPNAPLAIPDLTSNQATGGTFKLYGDSDNWNIDMVSGLSANVAPEYVVLVIADAVAATNDVTSVEKWDETLFEVTADSAYENTIDDATSTFVAEDGNQTVDIDDEVVFELDVEDDAYKAAKGQVYIWAEETAGKASSALEVVGGSDSKIKNVFVYTVDNYADVTVKFTRSGEYTVYAAPAVVVDTDSNEVVELSKFDCEFSVIKVRSGAVDPEDAYKANGVDANGELDGVYGVVPNNVFDDEYEVVFTSNGQPMKGKTITIETNSASIEVSKASDKTDSQGKIDFAIAASVEGEYEVILSVDGVEWTIPVTVGNTAATYIENVKAPKAPLALWADFEDEDAVAFTITDINGNVFNGGEGMDGIAANKTTADGKYVVLTEAPAESDLESEDLGLAWDAADKVWYLDGVDAMDAEGTYAVKVILDNGAYATAEWTVKKFDKPVRLILGYATTTVELGSATTAKMIYIDKNGVQKLAKDADFAATGYAVADAGIDNAANFPTAYVTNGDGYGKIIVKSDEKYVGETIKVTAVSTKYDLVGTATLTVAEGASEIAFADAKADVDVNNKLVWNVVDAAGNKVTLTNGIKATTTDIKYIVLDKPEGAKVSVNDATNVKDLNSKGEGAMRLVSNKVGNVTVQVILKAEYAATAGDDNMQVKYYTGTVIVPVGTDSTGDVVVMSIGSNQIVKNDKVATMAAAPIIKDNRTFVPFRALAEAFGAEVEWVEATQSVVAELNGVKVVMNIGEAAYTVNGVAATADVAPFINGASTMVPVRFVAEAFGINVIPTYDNNGATADILFNL